jgi:hypothetical protein
MFNCHPPDNRIFKNYTEKIGKFKDYLKSGAKRWFEDGISQFQGSHRFCSPPFCMAGPFPEKKG